MDIDALNLFVRNEAISVLAQSGFSQSDIMDDAALVDDLMPTMIQALITREAAILNHARKHVRESLTPRYAQEWQKQASWAEARLANYHDLGERYPFPQE